MSPSAHNHSSHVARGQRSGHNSHLPCGPSGCRVWCVFYPPSHLPGPHTWQSTVTGWKWSRTQHVALNVAVISVWRQCGQQMFPLTDTFIHQARLGAVLTPPPPQGTDTELLNLIHQYWEPCQAEGKNSRPRYANWFWHLIFPFKPIWGIFKNRAALSKIIE